MFVPGHRRAVAAVVGVVVAAGAVATSTAGAAAAASDRTRAATYPVGPHSKAEWKKHRSVGDPIGPERAVTMAGQTGYIQVFANKAEIVTSSLGSFIVSGDMLTRYGSGSTAFGWPAGESFTDNHHGYRARAQYFSRTKDHRHTGMLVDRVGARAFWIINTNLSSYIRNGGTAQLGYPTHDRVYIGRCREYLQVMTEGTLYSDGRWCPSTAYAQAAWTQPSAGAGYELKSGWNGTAVYFAQHALRVPTTGLTATIGPKTSAALKRFQTAHGLSPTGVIDKKTWSKLGTGYPFSTGTWKLHYGVATKATRTARIDAMIHWAKSQSGRQYLWGGTGNQGTPVGFDCSGFLLQAMRYAGVKPTRIANYYDEYPTSDLSDRMWTDKEFQHVSLKSLQRGDFVFYGSSKVHHAAMYLGNGRAIQAVDDKVKTLSVNDTSGWPKIFGAARPLSSVSPNTSGWQAGVVRAHATRTVTDQPRRVTDARPTLMINGSPLSPQRTKIHAGQHLSAAAGDRIVWVGGGYVVGVSGPGGVAPHGTTEALVLPAAETRGIGVDAAVIPVS